MRTEEKRKLTCTFNFFSCPPPIPPSLPHFSPLSPHYGGVRRPSLVFDTDSLLRFLFSPLDWQEKGGLKQSQSKQLSRRKLCSGMKLTLNINREQNQPCLSTNIMILISQMHHRRFSMRDCRLSIKMSLSKMHFKLLESEVFDTRATSS